MYELENDDEIEIDLRELFLALKKKIVWILLTAIVFAGASGLITKFAMTPIYSSTAQLYVVSKGGLSQLTDLTMGTQLTQDYMVIVKTRPVLEQVIADLKLDMDYKELEGCSTCTEHHTGSCRSNSEDSCREDGREITNDHRKGI